MSDPRPLYKALILAVLMAVLHFAAVKFYFYWSYWWYDVLLHFLAGVVGGLAAYWTLFSSGHFLSSKASRKLALTLIPVLVLIVGICWEVFEFKTGFTDSHEGYIFDTSNDLILDYCGAILAVLISWHYRRIAA